MGTSKTYFLARGWDYPSDSISLGSIITNPTQPQLAIFTPTPQDLGSPIVTTDKSHFTLDLTARDSTDNAPGLFGTFLSQYGLGSEDSFHYDRKTVGAYSFSQMQSRSFEPTKALINKAVAEAGRVSAFCRASEYKTPVYMITGLKSIQGASVTAMSSKGPGWEITLSLDIASPDKSKISTNPGSRGGGPLPIVFAFQLAQLRLSADGKVSAYSNEFDSSIGSGSDDGDDIQGRLDGVFGEGTFTSMDGFDEEVGSPCQIIAPSLTSFDPLTASSARTDPAALRANRR